MELKKRGVVLGVTLNFMLVVVLLIFFFAAIPKEALALYEMRYFCSNDLCSEGNDFVVSLRLFQFNNSVRYTAIEIKDSILNSSIAYKSELNITVIPGKNSSLTIAGIFPKSSSGKTLSIIPCFTFTGIDSKGKDFTRESTVCGTRAEAFYVYSAKELNCSSNNDCPTELTCKSNSCAKFSCSSCQYQSNHTCIDYACCSSSVCKEDESCTNHVCEKLSCSFSQAIVDHECLNLACKEDEYASDNVCKSLDCRDDQKIFNHSCIDLDCKIDEKITNRKCEKFICPLGQIPENHACVKFTCGFFMIAENNSCSFDYRLLLKIIFALAIIIGVGGWLYRRYREQHPKNQIILPPIHPPSQ